MIIARYRLMVSFRPMTSTPRPAKTPAAGRRRRRRENSGARFRTVGSVWGHLTMFGLREQDIAEIDALYAEVLAS
jgi:hypothetical protein